MRTWRRRWDLSGRIDIVDVQKALALIGNDYFGTETDTRCRNDLRLY